ncbi:hypothetical protein J4460_00250 [Candidatus Woesearchaeota archaeon]|nr:MAG: orotate phosphoribosyltransferase [archaeon GW2011_AR4]MBS3129081.1 hypothetical protein [Candidatus Woesearchaeota archaeon]HIH37815.1 hypothetical protein [Candidatus Woesearchaeota archaeon]HIH48411.1 hypothetical protein [Candidatus Woesearchaeota archaeon]HIJ03940.1 hypothetical protein [Candidatus Woesearchaeota archaeon]
MSEAFDKKAYCMFILNQDVIGFFDEPITLKSGRISQWYVNCRNLWGRYGVTEQLISFLLAFTKEKNLHPDYYYGVPEGATGFAILLNYEKAKAQGNNDAKLVYGRGKPKDHGAPKDKYFLGPAEKGDKVIILEDVTTTGGSLLTTLASLREAGIDVVGAIGLVNRMERRDDTVSVEEKLKKEGIPYYFLAGAHEILPLARKKVHPKQEIIAAVENYFKEYGTVPLVW